MSVQQMMDPAQMTAANAIYAYFDACKKVVSDADKRRLFLQIIVSNVNDQLPGESLEKLRRGVMAASPDTLAGLLRRDSLYVAKSDIAHALTRFARSSHALASACEAFDVVAKGSSQNNYAILSGMLVDRIAALPAHTRKSFALEHVFQEGSVVLKFLSGYQHQAAEVFKAVIRDMKPADKTEGDYQELRAFLTSDAFQQSAFMRVLKTANPNGRNPLGVLRFTKIVSEQSLTNALPQKMCAVLHEVMQATAANVARCPQPRPERVKLGDVYLYPTPRQTLA